MLLGFALRVWGIDFGLPFLYHSDEPNKIMMAQRMFVTGDLNPHYFNYPSLFIYLNALLYIPYYGIGNLLGLFDNPQDLLPPVMFALGVGKSADPTTILLGRLLTAVSDTITLYIVYHIGNRLTEQKIIGLLATFILAISPTHIINSHYITPDIFVTFFIAASLWASLNILNDGRLRYYLIAGALVGLATSSKYPGAIAGIIVVAAHLGRYGLINFGQHFKLIVAGTFSLLAFAATTPYAILDYEKFLHDLSFEGGHYSSGHAGMEGEALQWYLSYLWRVEGAAFVLSIGAIIWGIYQRSKPIIVTAVFPIVYFIFISSFVVRNGRTALLLIPFICLLAAAGILALLQWLQRRHSSTLVWSITGLLFLFLLWPLKTVVPFNINLTASDGRETSRVWIEKNVPAGAKLAIDSYSPYLEPDKYVLQHFNPMLDKSVDWYRDNGFDYLIFSEGSYGRFYNDPDRYGRVITEYETMFDSLNEVKIFDDGKLEVRLYAVP
ncbi:MAG: glycosyltransferase family 39 protein [Chloroflexi bacterium]|nr:glycosyltransferase family 39 protein [Chloroflexota bacterium]